MIFEINQYLAEYVKIISLAKKRILKNNFLEKHHVVPKSIDPKLINEKNNVVLLTLKEHHRCHELLPQFLTNTSDKEKMLKAFWIMSHSRNKKFINSQDYEKLKIEYRKSQIGRKLSEKTKKKMSGPRPHMSGKNNPRCKYPVTRKTKEKHSLARKGKNYIELFGPVQSFIIIQKGITKRSISLHGRKRTEYQKKSTSKTLKSKPLLKCSYCDYSTRNKGQLKANHEEFCIYAPYGLEKRKERQKKRQKQKRKCPHCSLLVDPGNYKRHHGKNCKLNDSFWEEW